MLDNTLDAELQVSEAGGGLPGARNAARRNAIDPEADPDVDGACEQACRTIAPAWPLDRAIAVNPHWHRIHLPLRRVAARMAVLGGIHVLPTRGRVKQAWDSGRIEAADLDWALANAPEAGAAGLTRQDCLAALAEPQALPSLPLLIDVLDTDPRRHTRLSWRQAITHQVSQTCAAYFDEHQADWQPWQARDLYGFWRATLQRDHGIGLLMGLPELHGVVAQVPPTRQQAETWVLRRLGLPRHVWADYLEAVLLTVQGWASWCAWLGWEAQLQGRQDEHLRDLLAIRLAWGAVLLECTDDAAATQAFGALQQAWREAPVLLAQAERTLLADEVWQRALERGFQRRLASTLVARAPGGAVTAGVAGTGGTAELQAVFCIDVRSEPLRRALEATSDTVQTLGAAGFFGLPVAYTPFATPARRPQLPGLLAPALEVEEHLVAGPAAPAPAAPAVAAALPDAALEQAARSSRRLRLENSRRWNDISRWPGGAYAFVEAAGAGYLAGLTRWLRPPRHARARDELHGLPGRLRSSIRPRLAGMGTDAKVALAARALHSMGLERDFAPLVLLVGHGSQSANNAHHATLECGACGGQSGEANARALAALLNEAEVRRGLAAKGVQIPAQTWFVAALHNTATDEIEGFDLDLLPPNAADRWQRAQPLLASAGEQVRRERAPRLGLDAQSPAHRLLDRLRARANDGAQTRPEWGLAGNAAFVIAARERTRALPLQGRCFLHEYRADEDPDGSWLEGLMTAPMVVTHWINWQYHASTCDPERLGSGNKLLHNVVGGRIGVFEGNGGDLRIGLARQSLHDGQDWVHEPLRLTVVVDAPAMAIEQVLRRHPPVRHLVTNGWLHLWRFDGAGLSSWHPAGWRPVTLEGS